MASLWKAMKNKFRENKDKAAEAMGDPIRDGGYAIQDSEKELARIKGEIAKYSASIKKNQRLLDTEVADVRKWGNIAKKAADAGKIEDVTKCVTEKANAQERVDNLKKMIKNDEGYLAKMKTDWQKQSSKVSTAKSKHSQAAARSQMAKARIAFAKGKNDIDSNSCFSQLDKAMDAVNDDECEAEALEEMAPDDSIEDMAAQYGSAGEGAVDDEVAKLMAAAANKS